MNINTFVFGAYAILSTRFLHLYKPFTLVTHHALKLPGCVVPTRHIYNHILLYAYKPDVRKQLSFGSVLQSYGRWFQTTASDNYR